MRTPDTVCSMAEAGRAAGLIDATVIKQIGTSSAPTLPTCFLLFRLSEMLEHRTVQYTVMVVFPTQLTSSRIVLSGMPKNLSVL